MSEFLYWSVKLAVGIYVAFAAFFCLYAFFANSDQEVSVRINTGGAWFVAQGVGALALTVAGSSWAGLVLAWLVTIICAWPFSQIRRTGRSCGCYGQDHRFIGTFFPYLISAALVATGLLMCFPVIHIAPSADTELAVGCTTAAFYAAMWRYHYTIGAFFQRQPFRSGLVRTHSSDIAQVLLWGTVGCAPCRQSTNDLITILQAMPGRFSVNIALDGYPDDAPRHFKDVAIIEPSIMLTIVPFDRTPSLALLDGNGGYKLFEGVQQIRIGLGYMMSEA